MAAVAPESAGSADDATLGPRRRGSKSAQASFLLIPDTGDYERVEQQEAVPDGHFSLKFTAALSKSYYANDGDSGVMATLRAAAITVVGSGAMAFVAYLVPLGDPFVGARDNLGFIFYGCVVSSPPLLGVIVLYFTALLNVPVSRRVIAIAVATGLAAFLVSLLVVGFAFDGLFPFPYTIATLGTPAALGLLGTVYFSFPRALRSNKRFFQGVLRANNVTNVMIGTSIGCVLYNTLFKQAIGTPMTQHLLAVGLPTLKWAIKVAVKKATNAGDNPDFAHGAAYAIDLSVAMICAVIFTNIDSFFTFALLIACDLVVNFYYCVQITSTIVQSLREQQQVAREALAAGDTAAASAALLGGDGVDGENVFAGSKGPRVAYLLSNLFFVEMTEIAGPLVMGTTSLVVYYLCPNENYTHITFMDERLGVTEEKFLRGMGFVLLDAVIEAGVLMALVRYMRKVVGVDPMRVGWFVVGRHREYFFLIHLAFALFFLAIFLRHNGADTAFAFAWLRSDFKYDPDNATSTAALLWS